jgi:hypothetical protein
MTLHQTLLEIRATQIKNRKFLRSQRHLELSMNAIHTPTNVLDRRRHGKVVKGITLVAQIHIHKKKLSLVKNKQIVQVIV